MYEPLPNPKNSPLGPQKVKNDPKINQNQISELKETKKMEVVQLHENTLPYPIPQNIQLGLQKAKSDPKIMSKSKVRIETNIEN